MDRTSSNLECTQSDHRRVTSLFRNSDILLHFKMWAAQSQVDGSQEVCGPNFTKFSQDIGRSWPHSEFVSELRYFAVFSNAGGSNLSNVENEAKFRTF